MNEIFNPSSHIDFDITDWRSANPNGSINDLINAIESANRVYCGWTVDDAETIRTKVYPDRHDLTIEDSHAVMTNVADGWDASLGCTWEDLYAAYAEYLANT